MLHRMNSLEHYRVQRQEIVKLLSRALDSRKYLFDTQVCSELVLVFCYKFQISRNITVQKDLCTIDKTKDFQI